ncbi:hypothetical protein BD324DRAFT_636943 [Kockovaella imperatae]|uniref:Rap-GAP domain-containing protein n=1 Tax=Kockovaella imperatae TaxID=4999 RepID=A0A1Y1U9J5_9TREE|nr:hypothetical protein BD324DRAFT_636943 [Kockovaella imperatae]ORX34177.1 hypothetical protein BD324DRAFT_636943 [Kockovaella imperatae]
MSDRERLREPRAHSSHHASSSSGSGGLFMGLFGGSKKASATTTATASTSSSATASSSAAAKTAASRQVTKRDSLEEMRSPKSLSPHLPGSDALGVRRTQSPAPFDFQSNLLALQPGNGQSPARLVEIINTIATWLYNLHVTSDDVFAPPAPDLKPPITPADIRTLYIRAFAYAQSNVDSPLRTASIRLLAVLIETLSPSKMTAEGDKAILPDSINPRSLFYLITAPTDQSQTISRDNAFFVELGALKALTKNGAHVEGMVGLVGRLLRGLGEIQDDWAAWCMQPEDRLALQEWSVDASKTRDTTRIRVASPADTAMAVFELLCAIMSSHASLLLRSDFDKIINTLISFVIVGINASVTAHLDNPLSSSNVILSRNSSLREAHLPSSSIITTPSPTAMTGSGLLQRSGSTLRRTREDRMNSGSPPAKSISKSAVSPQGVTSPRSFPSATIGLRSPSPHTLRERDPAKWSRIIPSLTAVFETALNNSIIGKQLLKQMIAFICFCFGQDEDEYVPESIWETLSDVCGLMLIRKSGWKGQEILKEVLEGKASLKVDGKIASAQADRKLARGAVIASRFLLGRVHAQPSDTKATMSFPNLAPWLKAAESSSRFPASEDLSKRTDWLTVDLEILALIQDNLFAIEEGQAGGSNGSGILDSWLEGDAICDLLQGMVHIGGDPAARGLSQRRPSDTADLILPRFLAIFDEIIHQLPSTISRLDSSSSADPLFHHPKYIDLLLQLSPILDEEYAATVIGHYKRESLCLPFITGWLDNIDKLLQAFFFTAADLPTARSSVVNFLFGEVYSYANEVSEKRTKLVNRIILPFMERALQQDQDSEFLKMTLQVLVDAAIAETADRDADVRQWRGSLNAEELEHEDFATRPCAKIQEAASGGYFNKIRSIIIKVATQMPCRSDGLVPAPQRHALGLSALPPPGTSGVISSGSSHSGMDSPAPQRNVKGKETAGSALRGLMEALSPPSKSRDLTPASSSVASPTVEMEVPSLEAAALSISNPPSASPLSAGPTLPPVIPHNDCKSSIAVSSLITMFIHLAFAPSPKSQFSTFAVPPRSPSTMRTIVLFQDLLHLLHPLSESGSGDRIQARCPRARLSILQLMMRLRADSQHQIYLRGNLDSGALPYALILKRTVESEAEKRAELEMSQRKASARQARVESGTGTGEDRGRAGRTSEPTNRSRSRSTQPTGVTTSDTSSGYGTLWRIPDRLGFNMPPGIVVTGGIATYDPSHPLLKDSVVTHVEGVWLPVSQYVRTLIGILRGNDWELVSYIFTFLPLQISNKLFFHGVEATREIRSLLDLLCSGVLALDPWERRFSTPAFIKRVDINAAAYHTLSILIAYRGLFSRAECDRLVQAFMTGLQGKGDVAKPCIQALAVAVFELESSVSRNLLEIVRAMISILTTTGLAVHILEFLISLGQNGALFRNFTDEQYRLVFRVAITYITEHNARSDQTVDLTDPVTREAYVLSQHVIGLAYYAIYIWFMALRLPQRPTVASEITRELLKGRSQRLNLDEMVEVCFDWLARYTYGNADPKPATSFLSEIVMQDDGGEPPKSQSWLLGGSIVTVTTHSRTGWATITTTRPTGSTSVICKLENVPHLDLGEDNADLVSLPAVLMADRESKPASIEADSVGGGEAQSETSMPEANATSADTSERYASDAPITDDKGDRIPSAKDIVNVQSSGQSTAATFDQGSQHGYVWSGATPSQRRKDVSIEPSYIALQLLSSYPNASLESPRGRLIPNDDRFARALRGIQNTPVIDTLKIAVLYVGRDQTTEQEILSNTDGPRPYLDFLAGLGRLIRLKGQVDVFVGGLNRDNDSDGQYAYAWWDDLTQMILHTPTMMPNDPSDPTRSRKKRLVGNDMIKIVYNDSGREFAFDTIKTQFNWINIVVSPHSLAPGEDDLPVGALRTGWRDPLHGPWAGQGIPKSGDTWLDWDREDWFKVTLQRADGIPDFSPIGTHKLVSKKTLPIMVREIAHLANDMASRYVNVRDATDAAKAEYITSWRSRLRAMSRLKQMLPPIELPPADDIEAREQMLRDFTRIFSDRSASKD